MTETTRGRLPAPVAEAFVVCSDIWQDQQSSRYLLVDPATHICPPKYPTKVRLSAYVHLTGGHGRYHLQLNLRDADDEVVWKWKTQTPWQQGNPLAPHQVTFYGLLLDVPRPGKYRLVLLAEGEEIAQYNLWFAGGRSGEHAPGG